MKQLSRRLHSQSRLLAASAVLALATLWLAGCSESPPPAQGGAAPEPFGPAAPAQLAWQGVLACADCEGIDTRLVLESGDPPRYRLLETYLADDGEAFNEEGRWRRDGALLRLRADAGGERVYAIEADGRLSQRDRRGRVPVGSARLLAPVTPPSPP